MNASVVQDRLEDVVLVSPRVEAFVDDDPADALSAGSGRQHRLMVIDRKAFFTRDLGDGTTQGALGADESRRTREREVIRVARIADLE